MVSPIYSQEDVNVKINSFLTSKSAKFPELKLVNKSDDKSGSTKIFDALNSISKLISGVSAPTKQAHS